MTIVMIHHDGFVLYGTAPLARIFLGETGA